MARSSNALSFVTLGVVVIAAAFGVGYYVIGGPRTMATPPVSTPAVQTPPPKAAPRSVAPPHVTLRTKNADYTAPDAPPIKIVEEATPTMKRTAPRPASASDAGANDPEASQEASPPPALPKPDSPAVPADNSIDAGSDSTPPPTDTSPSTAPAAPNGTDYEQGGGKSTGMKTPDSEAGQEGAKAAFRVQTGSFAAQQNAKALADALRQRGYTTSTRSEQEGGRTVYKVQIGAYRSRAAADKAAQDLQKDGYPAYTSPMGP